MRHTLPNRIRDRQSAGSQLSRRLNQFLNHPNAIVLGVPRGGVPIAYEIAVSLNLPLDVCLVHKLGLPHNQELAMGAIASMGVRVLDYEIIAREGISSHDVDVITARELRKLQQSEHTDRGNRLFPKLNNKIVILVDDGIATGASVRAAISLLKPHNPEKIIVAVPVLAPSTYKSLKNKVDDIVCLMQPDPFYTVSKWYENFSQVSDEAVCQLLKQAEMRTHNETSMLIPV